MPEERRVTITSSPHLAADDVARHTFASVRRGFDPAEVRDYLESLATGLRSQAEREQQLLDALAAAEERAANPVIDESMLTNAVGKETARVLQSAHDAAAEMVANTEAETARQLAEAQAEAERLLAEATALNSRPRSGPTPCWLSGPPKPRRRRHLSWSGRSSRWRPPSTRCGPTPKN